MERPTLEFMAPMFSYLISIWESTRPEMPLPFPLTPTTHSHRRTGRVGQGGLTLLPLTESRVMPGCLLRKPQELVTSGLAPSSRVCFLNKVYFESQMTLAVYTREKLRVFKNNSIKVRQFRKCLRFPQEARHTVGRSDVHMHFSLCV